MGTDYTFTLTFHLDPSDRELHHLVERLGKAGCNDALVGLGQVGWLAMEFVREAPTAKKAIESALRDVRRAVPRAVLIEASPDLVGLTDVAQHTGVSRQNIRKLLIQHSATAPRPVHAGNPSLWHLTDMLEWLGQELGYQYSPETFDIARAAEIVNLNKEAGRSAGRRTLRRRATAP